MATQFTKKFTSLLVSLILLLLLVVVQNLFFDSPSGSPSPPTSTKLIKVIDGDTIEVIINGQSESVRLIGIDTPELAGPYTKEACFGPEASQRLKELVSDKNILLVSDALSSDRDKYQRLLRYVYLGEININALMIEEGYAKFFSSFTFDKFEEFKALEEEAQAKNRGLWRVCQQP